MSIVLGLDLSIASTGWSIVEDNKILAYGIIETKKLKTTNVQLRLKFIVKELNKIVTQYQPTAALIEEVYHGVNVKTVAVLNRLNGAVVVSLPDNIEVTLINASSARKDVLGKGKKHSKEDVFNWATSKFSLKCLEFDKHNDITDSILLACFGLLS